MSELGHRREPSLAAPKMNEALDSKRSGAAVLGALRDSAVGSDEDGEDGNGYKELI